MKPNVIVICADDLGYGDINMYGNSDICTPNLDRLVENGIHLTQHYSASPLCAPARGSLLTGQYNHRIGALSVESNRGLDRIDLSAHTMADCFKAAGYSTGMIGKWHNGLFSPQHHPNNRGFDDFFGFLNGGMWYYRWILDENGRAVKSDGTYLTDKFSERAVSYIRSHKHENFFLYLAYNTPHDPLEAPEEQIQYYRDMNKFSEEVCRVYAMITRMDRGIGKIIEELDSDGLIDDTIILFTSDNGPVLRGPLERFNGPFSGEKGHVLEGGIRVPAIVHWPAGIPDKGRCAGNMIHFTDWLPTLLSACSLETFIPKQTDGNNVMPILRGEQNNANVKRFWQYNRYEPVCHSNLAMRDGPWKLYYPYIPGTQTKLMRDNVWYVALRDMPHFMLDGIPNIPFPEREIKDINTPRLFNLENDTYEKVDLSAQYPEIYSRMKAEAENWFYSVEKQRKKLYAKERSRIYLPTIHAN